MPKIKRNSPLIDKRQEEQKKLLVDHLRKIPIVQVACEKLGVSRATYYRWIAEDATFATQTEEALSEGTGFINDMAESQLISAIKEQNFAAISFWLRNRHKAYANKVQITTPVKQELTDKEKQMLADAYQKLGLISTNMEPYDKQQPAGPADAGSGDEQQDGEN